MENNLSNTSHWHRPSQVKRRVSSEENLRDKYSLCSNNLVFDGFILFLCHNSAIVCWVWNINFHVIFCVWYECVCAVCVLCVRSVSVWVCVLCVCVLWMCAYAVCLCCECVCMLCVCCECVCYVLWECLCCDCVCCVAVSVCVLCLGAVIVCVVSVWVCVLWVCVWGVLWVCVCSVSVCLVPVHELLAVCSHQYSHGSQSSMLSIFPYNYHL